MSLMSEVVRPRTNLSSIWRLTGRWSGFSPISVFIREGCEKGSVENKRERERASADRFAHNWPMILYVEQHARAFYIFIHTHTKRCEIIKQTNKQKSVRMNIVVSFRGGCGATHDVV